MGGGVSTDVTDGIPHVALSRNWLFLTEVGWQTEEGAQNQKTSL